MTTLRTSPPATRPDTRPTSRWIDLDRRRLHLLEWSPPHPRQTLVCVHGGCANAHWWYHCGNLLGADHRVLAIDLSGHGESDPQPNGAYSLESHAQDIADVFADVYANDRAASGLSRAVLVGHSFGAFVSLAAVPLLAESLAALVLVDSRGHIRKRAARYLNALGKFRNPIYENRAQAVESFQLLPRAHSAAPAILRHVAEHSIRETPDGGWTLAFDRRALRAATERSFAREMAQVQCPTLIVRGERSTTLTETGLKSLLAEIPGSRCEVVENAHHHVMLDEPEAFARVLASFLDDLSDESATDRQPDSTGVAVDPSPKPR